mgnify:FL=1
MARAIKTEDKSKTTKMELNQEQAELYGLSKEGVYIFDVNLDKGIFDIYDILGNKLKSDQELTKEMALSGEEEQTKE